MTLERISAALLGVAAAALVVVATGCLASAVLLAHAH
jgi:hypothetical protein